MGALSAGECCVDDYDDSKKESDKKKALIEQQEYENSMQSNVENIKETKKNETIPFAVCDVPPWEPNNSVYRNKLSYVEMSKRYNYRKPPNFYDDCIRKLRKTKRHYQSTQKQSQYDAIIQNTSKSILRARTMLTASFEEQQQTSGTNLIHEISEDDNSFWFQPFLYNVIDSITNAFIKLMDSRQNLLLNYIDIYQLLTLLPVLSDVLHKDYPFHFHSQMHDRLKYLFNENDIIYVKTQQDIINVISKANKSNRKICAVGYGTTISSNNNSKKNENPLIVAMIPNHLRSYTLDTQIEFSKDLSRCFVPNYPLMYIEDIGNNRVRIGGATPLWLYVEWCHKRIESNKSILSEPSSTMSLYHSFVGLITIDEHGSGYMTSPLSDYVTKMKILNSDGKENEYSIENNEAEFKSLLPHLGLLGIVTEIELQFEEEYYCNLNVRVINIDKLFPKSKSKKTKGRTFSKMFEDIINNTLYNEFFWFPTTNQIYSVSLDQCINDNTTSQYQFFPSKTWEKNWVALQREINILNEILCIQLLNGNTWTSQLATKLITKISVNLFNDLVVKINLRPQISKTSSPRVNVTPPATMKLPSCDALHFLCEFYPSQSNNNLFNNVEWLFPLDSKSGKKILINDHHVVNVELAAHLFMSAINCYNQNMLKRQYFPYQHALNLKIIKGSQCKVSHCNGADFYCALNMNVYDIKNNTIFQQFHKEFIQTCKYKVYSGNSDGLVPHWRNCYLFDFMQINHKSNDYNPTQNGYKNDKNDMHSFVKYQYKEKLDKLNEVRHRDNKNPQIFEKECLQRIFNKSS